MRLLVLALCSSLTALAGLDEVVRQLHQGEFDPAACYRIHDLKLNREDARIYLNSGFLILLKPIEGRRVAAAFIADIEEEDTGDAEILLIPPTRSERASLASFTQSPNMNEHFHSALFLFSDDTAEDLLRQIEQDDFNRKAAAEGERLAQEWTAAFRNLSSSFEIRLLRDLLGGKKGEDGFFFAAIAGKSLGTFDLFYDPQARDQITLGKISSQTGRTHYDFWVHFPGRSFREEKRQVPGPEFQITNYQIQSRIQEDLRLQAKTSIQISLTHPLSVLAFDLSQQMNVMSASIDGVAAKVYRKESLRASLIRGDQNEMFLLVPSQPIQPGVHQVVIHHEGNVIGDAGNGVYYVASRVNWYPQRGNHFADYDLIFRFPRRLDLVASGELISERIEAEEKIVHRKSTSPIRFAGFNLGDYIKSSATSHDLQVDLYANRNLEKALEKSSGKAEFTRPGAGHISSMAQEIADYYSWLSSRLGPPPQRVLSVSPIPGQFGQGFAGLLYLSTLSYLGLPEGLSREMQMYYSGLLYSHETAHQWWGNSVTSPHYADDWLQEALANYLALMALERKGGTEPLKELLEEFRHRLLQEESDGNLIDSIGPVTFGVRLQNSKSPTAWRTIVYDKGTWIIHMLRKRMGDELFWNLLTDLSSRYRRQTLSTAQFQRAAMDHLARQNSSPESYRSLDPKLDVFFDTWIYGTGIPEWKLEWKTKKTGTQIHLTGTIFQSKVPDEFVDILPVQISFADGKTIRRWIRTIGEETGFQIPLTTAPVRVELDPEREVLRR